MEKLTSKTYFKEVSGSWDNMGNSFFGEAPRRAIYERADFKEGDVVVDVGCGTGYLTEALDLGKLEIKAIDQSPEMLAAMREKLGDSPNVEYLEGHSASLPVKNDVADIVMANMYVHHVEDPEKAISEMVRILKPGGKIIFTDLDQHNHTFLVTEQHDRWMGFRRSDITAWMEAAGLQSVVVDCVGANCCADSSNQNERAEISVFIASGTKP